MNLVGPGGIDVTPGRYAGAQAQEDDGEPIDEEMKRLAATLRVQRAEPAELDAAIGVNLSWGLGGPFLR